MMLGQQQKYGEECTFLLYILNTWICFNTGEPGCFEPGSKRSEDILHTYDLSKITYHLEV